MNTAVAQNSPTIRVGRWWFKNRSLSPLPFFALLIALKPNLTLEVGACVAVGAGIILAEVLRIWAVGYAGSATRTRGDRVPQLVTAGPYRHVRNPLYVANILQYTLCGVLFGFTYLSGVIFVYSCIQYTFIVAFEEELLARTFGTSYEEYCRRVPRWWWSITPSCPASPHDFQLGRALRSERSTLYSMTGMAVFFFLKRYVG